MGPLAGLRIIELAAIGPVPFAGMMLSDLGADVVMVGRTEGESDPLRTLMGRGRRRIAVDLKRSEGRQVVERLVETSDVFIEGMRPGVVERLGLGPERLLELNPRLVIGRMTGWGQRGPYAAQAGHDINYLGVTGGLYAIGSRDSVPPPPLNLVADFGGGAMYLITGVLAALIERESSGRGQVVDAAMVDGASSLLTMAHQMLRMSVATIERESNLLDGGAPFYRTYACADGLLVSVGAIEPQFFATLVAGLGFDESEMPGQLDRSAWPSLRLRFAERFATRTRPEWLAVFAGSDGCVFPVHTLEDAHGDPHLAARGTLSLGPEPGLPAPAPRFSRSTHGRDPETPGEGDDPDALLGELGYSTADIAALRRDGIVG